MTAKKKPVEKLSTEDDKAPDLDTKGTEVKAAELSTADDKAPDLDTKGTEVKAAKYRVAEGLSITTKRGTLSAGAMIEPRDLPGGQASIDALLKLKKIKKL